MWFPRNCSFWWESRFVSGGGPVTAACPVYVLDPVVRGGVERWKGTVLKAWVKGISDLEWAAFISLSCHFLSYIIRVHSFTYWATTVSQTLDELVNEAAKVVLCPQEANSQQIIPRDIILNNILKGLKTKWTCKVPNPKQCIQYS